MTDKVQKIISNLKDVIDDLGVTSPHRLPIIEAIECLQEEPVSEELEKEFNDIYHQLGKEYSQVAGLGGFHRGGISFV